MAAGVAQRASSGSVLLGALLLSWLGAAGANAVYNSDTDAFGVDGWRVPFAEPKAGTVKFDEAPSLQGAHSAGAPGVLWVTVAMILACGLGQERSVLCGVIGILLASTSPIFGEWFPAHAQGALAQVSQTLTVAGYVGPSVLDGAVVARLLAQMPMPRWTRSKSEPPFLPEDEQPAAAWQRDEDGGEAAEDDVDAFADGLWGMFAHPTTLHLPRRRSASFD